MSAGAVAVAAVDALAAGGPWPRRVAGIALGAALPAGVALAIGRSDAGETPPRGRARAGFGSGAIGRRNGASAGVAGAYRPADVVTFVRAVLAGCAFAAALRPTTRLDRRRAWAVAGFAIPALALDAVDGRVARVTGTASPAGARLDMETDAAVLLGLTAILARTLTPRALVIGAARYVFVAGRLVRPAWAGELPPSERRRTVAGLQAVAASVAAAPVVPAPLARRLLTGAAGLLLWSFALDVVILERADARAEERHPGR